MTLLLDGKKSAQHLLEQLKSEIRETIEKASGGNIQRNPPPFNRPPCLAILQVGENPASGFYIKRKINVAKEIGASTQHVYLPRDASDKDIVQKIRDLSDSPEVDALIMQLPLDQETPSNAEWVHNCLEMIPPSKDADGLHSQNLGLLSSGMSSPKNWTSPLPATAFGIMNMLEFFEIDPSGKRVLVIGKSRLVGMPSSLLMTHAGGTVCTVHSKSGDWSDVSKKADIIIAAAGVKHLLKPDQISEKSVLIDVGIHKENKGLTGDVDPSCYDKCSAYSPVPGGVGQMTVACLMANLVNLWKKSAAKH